MAGNAKKKPKKPQAAAKAAAPRVSVAARFASGAACVSVGLLWLCAASTYVSPEVLPVAGLLGLGFPFFLGGTLFMLVVTLLFAPRRAWIPVAGLLGCAATIYTYCPVNLTSPAPKGCLRVMTWNTQGFGGAARNAAGKIAAGEYIRESGADIVCFQEAWVSKAYLGEVKEQVSKRLPYMDTVLIYENLFGIFSRYPIVGKRLIAAGRNNGSAVFFVELARGDTLQVLNNHLESMHLVPEERAMWSSMAHAPERADVDKEKSRRLLSKVASATAVRAGQADKVADYVFRHKDRPMIVCGDFNDTPVSYTRRRIAKGLTDAYRATANGIGRTFNRDAIYVRIDHMFCTDHWKPYSCRVQDTVKISDHYPVTCSFKRVRKK